MLLLLLLFAAVGEYDKSFLQRQQLLMLSIAITESCSSVWPTHFQTLQPGSGFQEQEDCAVEGC